MRSQSQTRLAAGSAWRGVSNAQAPVPPPCSQIAHFPLHFALQVGSFPSILHPKSLLSLNFATQMPQAQIFSSFDRCPGNTLSQNGSIFDRFPDIFQYFLKKCDLSKTCTGMSGLHVRPSPGAPFSPNLSSKSSVVKRARNLRPNGDA